MTFIDDINLYALISASALFTIIFITTLRSVSTKINLVDKASHRKLHTGEIPLIGGISIFLGFIFSLLLSPIFLGEYRILFAVCIVIIIIGCLDDLHELSSTTKFVIEILLGFICIFWGKIELLSLGDIVFLGEIQLGLLSLPFTIFCIIGIVNSINMLDGSDGLVGTTSVIQLSFLAYIAYESRLWNDYYIIILLIQAIIGFLCFNLPLKYIRRNNLLVFLGDNGSLFIGMFLTWFLIKFSQDELTFVSPVVMLWIMALPIYDTIAVMIQRTLKGFSVLEAKRDHFHHSFNIKNPKKIIIFATTINISFGTTGLLLKKYNVYDGYSLIIFTFISIIYLYWKLNNHK